MGIFKGSLAEGQNSDVSVGGKKTLRVIVIMALLLGGVVAFLASPLAEKTLGWRLTNLFSSADLSDELVIAINGRTGSEYIDATAEIRDAITTLQAGGGGTLFFSPGKYLVQETIDIPSNISFQGSGVGEVGPTMIILGNNGDLDASGMALFSISTGARNITIRDIEFRSMTPGPNVYPRYDTDRIRNEETTGLRMYGSAAGTINNITLQNVKFVNFTYGIDVGSNDGSDAIVDAITMRSVVSNMNYKAIRVNSFNAKNWDVQNLNLVEMGEGQHGVELVKAGKMSFLQLSCASTLWDAELCLDIDRHNGPLYFYQAHVEGPQQGLRVRSGSRDPIFFDNSAIGGTIEGKSVIYSFANRFWLDDDTARFTFVGDGVGSTLYACADVFTTGYPNPEERRPQNPYPGILDAPGTCNFDVTVAKNDFQVGTLPYKGFDWAVSSADADLAVNVRDFGAVGNGVEDDTKAFRMAIAAANGIGWKGKTILVPAGRYVITDTLQLTDGVRFQGERGSELQFAVRDKAMFQVRALQTDSIIKRGIGLDNLDLISLSKNHLESNVTAIELSGTRGAASDFSFSNLYIANFTRGFSIKNDSGVFDEQQPQFDSIAVRNIEFANNFIAVDMRDQNASNWNFENIKVVNMERDYIGIRINGGNASIRGLHCEGLNSGEASAAACISLSRTSGFTVNGMTTKNMKHAFYGDWAIGWTPFPIVIRNSDLTDGFYAAGKMYLLSVSNTYADGSDELAGSNGTYFDQYGSLDPQNVYPGDTSIVTSCDDTFISAGGERSDNPTFRGLITPPELCAGTVIEEVPLAIGTTSLVNGQVGAEYSDQVDASGGSQSYAWSIISGSLPEGLVANQAECLAEPCKASLVISGVPTNSGVGEFTVQVTSGEAVVSKLFRIDVQPAPTTETGVLIIEPNSITTNVGDNAQVRALFDNCPAGAECLVGPVAVRADWALDDPSIASVTYLDNCPAGAECLSDQVDYTTALVSGLQEGATVITATYQDEQAQAYTSKASVKIVGSEVSIISITTESIGEAKVGEPYTATFAASGGVGNYAWSAVVDDFAGDYQINAASGAFSAVPTQAGTYTVRVTVSDSADPKPATVTKDFDLVVNPEEQTEQPHPNGTLITNFPDNPTGVWLIENGLRRPFPNEAVFMSHGYKWSSLVDANSADALLPAGDGFTLASGTLIRGSKARELCLVYPPLTLRCFSNIKAFHAMGYHVGMAYRVTDEYLKAAGYVHSAPIDDVIVHPIGTDVRFADGTIYWVSGSGRHPYPNAAVYNSWHTFEDDYSRVVEATELDSQLPILDAVTARTVGQ